MQVGAQTCTRLLAFREIWGIYTLINQESVSLLQVVEEES